MRHKTFLQVIAIILFSCSCSRHETFIVEGNIADVKDSVMVVLYQTIDPVARVSIGVAEDTLIRWPILV